MLRLHDTATGTTRELQLRDPGRVGIYVCGPTVYGPPHLGHGRSTLTYDVLRRYLRWSGLEVRFVSNITDIEDKIIDRALREGRPFTDITTKCEAVWWQAMDAIGVERPDHTPHATEYVAEMVELIEQLVERGHAYVTSDGVYFSARSVPDYGLLTHQSLDDMRAGGGEREVIGDDKRDPADFALWKLAKANEPTWPSPWGDGRPGWHTECVVMSLDLLGPGFDLHTGGQDLKFPHHENERAQAVASGTPFATHWMHHGFVVDPSGEKMSKSLGNFDNLLDLIETVDPRAYRLLVLQAHYRSPLAVDRDSISRAETALGRLDGLARRVADAGVATATSEPEVLVAFRERMDDDLDTPGAMAVVFEAVRRANAAFDAGEVDAGAALAAAVADATGALGLVAMAADDEVPADVLALAAELDQARAAKDFATADARRAQLQGAGWLVETTKDGTRVRKA